MALSTARMPKVRGRPPLLAAGISSVIHAHASSGRSLGYIFSCIFPFYTTHEDFSDRLLDKLYEGGRTVSEAFKKHMPIVFDSVLPKWNYWAVPQCV